MGGQVECFGNISTHLGAFNTKQATFDLAKLHQLFGQGLRHIAWDSKADTDAATAWCEDSGVNTNKFAVQIQQCAAGITTVNRGIGLDKVFQPFQVQTATT
ncbi:hypothetical protein D3C75_617650 [compost metagenome]